MKYICAFILTIILSPMWLIWLLMDIATGENVLKIQMKEMWFKEKNE
jgi:hypothetical protein